MHSRFLSASVVLLLLIGLAGSLQAAQVDYFLKIPGMEGESADSAHRGEIEILSWSWGESQSGTVVGGGGGAGKVSMQDFHFIKKMDKATPKLMLACASGQHISQVELFVRRPSADKPLEYLKVTLTDVIVSSYQTGGSGSDIPTESLSLNFAKIELAYTPYDAAGRPEQAVTFVWDLRTATQ